MRSREMRTAAGITAAALALAACGNSATEPTDTVARLGAVPIPTAPSTSPTPQASESRPQLLAIGAPLTVMLPTGSGLIVANGPYVAAPPIPTSAPAAQDVTVLGTFTLHLTAYQGSFRVALSDLSSRDEQGRAVPLSAVGAAGSLLVSPGKPAEFTVRGEYHDGSAQLTLRHDGKVLAVWDFSMELD